MYVCVCVVILYEILFNLFLFLTYRKSLSINMGDITYIIHTIYVYVNSRAVLNVSMNTQTFTHKTNTIYATFLTQRTFLFNDGKKASCAKSSKTEKITAQKVETGSTFYFLLSYFFFSCSLRLSIFNRIQHLLILFRSCDIHCISFCIV